mmetsp:Transcript_130759/g.364405  ORF Transcript_130759/g.364405 Transcript_130759/m.364405 type:complete len:124 (+) Transcript_130759:105-476(+)
MLGVKSVFRSVESRLKLTPRDEVSTPMCRVMESRGMRSENPLQPAKRAMHVAQLASGELAQVASTGIPQMSTVVSCSASPSICPNREQPSVLLKPRSACCTLCRKTHAMDSKGPKLSTFVAML